MNRRRLIRRVNELEQKLDARQIQFADEYIKAGDAVKAVKKMGFRDSHAEKRAFSFLKSEDLNEYITLRKRLVSSDIGVSRKQLAADLIEVKNRCMAAKPVLVRDPETRTMVESGEWTFDVTGALKALEKLEALMSECELDDIEPLTEIDVRAPSLEEREKILKSIAEEFKEGESL